MVTAKRAPRKGLSTHGKILVVHGPNLNLLGTREPEIYGRETLDEINQRLAQLAHDYNVVLEAFQSNHEGALIERIHAAKKQGFAFIVINPLLFRCTDRANSCCEKAGICIHCHQSPAF